jgi:DNA invertase Pin-like site-specific DNA recombinase
MTAAKVLPINGSKTKTAALYARYSIDEQEKRGIEDQFAFCKRHYAERNGFNIVATFADPAKTSATIFDRDDLIKMMQAAERREFDVILAEGLDRISSNPADITRSMPG